MAKLDNISIPDDVEMKIRQLVENDEFMSYEEAIRELLRSGMTAYQTQPDSSKTEFDSGFETDVSQPSHEDEYMF